MEKIKKGYNHIVIFIVLALLFLFIGTSHGYDLKTGFCLRKPLSTNIGEDIHRLAGGREAYLTEAAHLALVLQNIPQITHEVRQRLSPIHSVLNEILDEYQLPDNIRQEIESLRQQWVELSRLIKQALGETNNEEQSKLMQEVLLKVAVVTKSLETSLDSISKQPAISQLRFVREAVYSRLIDEIKDIIRLVKSSFVLLDPIDVMKIRHSVKTTLSIYEVSADLRNRVDNEIEDAVDKILRIRAEFLEAIGIHPALNRVTIISIQEWVDILLVEEKRKISIEARDKMTHQVERILALLDSLKYESQIINAAPRLVTPEKEKRLEEDMASIREMLSDVRQIFLIKEGEMSQVDINSILKRTVLSFTAVGFKGKIIEEYAPNLPLIKANPTELRQAFLNLLVNARDAISGKDDGQITVSTGLDDSGRYVVVKVIDNGSGISPDIRQRIFEPYFTTKGKKGTGLGLVIVKQIVEKYNGTINVESAVGKGTKFRVMLPIAVLGEAKPQYEYIEVELGKDEAKTVVQQIQQGVTAGATEYMTRFENGVKQKKQPFELVFRERLPPIHLDPELVFHKGLFKDEQGIYWILKKREIVPENQRDEREGRPDKNDPKRERFAYLLAQDRANLTEIRNLSYEEAQAVSYLRQLSPEELKEYYLVRVVTKGNMQGVNLSQQELSTAFSAILVANVLMRKWDQHLLNIGYVDTSPVSLDHDETFRNDIFAHTEMGFRKYLALYSFHVVIKSILSIINDANAANMLFFDDLRDIQRSGAVKSQHIIKNMIDDFGLGDGLLSAERWDEKQLQESIIAFKRISVNEIRKLANEAGYSGEELEAAVNFIVQNQRTLGADLDKLLKFLTNRNYDLSRIDKEFSSVHTLAGQPVVPILSEFVEGVDKIRKGI